MSEWLPIEEAPKDGREILGFCEDMGHAIIAWRKTMGGCHWFETSGDYGHRPPVIFHPTHFMRLTEPPK